MRSDIDTQFSYVGSVAAAAQSTFYGAWTSGVFSVLQSAGATATPYLGSAAASLVAGTVAIFS